MPVFGMEWIMIALVAFVFLFGSKKVPELARTIGKAMGELQKGKMEMEREMMEVTQPIREVSEEMSTIKKDMTDTQNQIVGDIKGNIDSLKNPDFKKMLDPKTQSSLDPNPKSDYKSNYVVNPPRVVCTNWSLLIKI